MIFLHHVIGAAHEIRRREWLLLALEFVTVLTGIIIAFQLNEWALGRKEAARQRQVIERLFDEARFNVAVLRHDRDEIRKMTEREESFAVQLTGQGLCPKQSEWWSAFSVNMYPAFTVQTSVYEEMMGAGGLSTIQNEKARNAVSDFHAVLKWTTSQNETRRARTQAPLEVGDRRLTATYDPDAEEALKIIADRTALCADPSFRNRIADAVRDHRFVYLARRDLTEMAIKMCSSLGRAIDKPCVPTGGGPLVGADADVAKAVEQPEV